LTTASGFNLTTSYLSVGKIPMNDQNSKYTDAYSLLDFKASYDFAILKNIKHLSTGVNNLTNSRYAASILPMQLVLGLHNHDPTIRQST
jgi:iron complex outermembrane receptor protein